MRHDITQLRNAVERLKGQKLNTKKRLAAYRDDYDEVAGELRCMQQAQKLIQDVAERTQRQLEYRLTELVTLALEAVYGEGAPSFGLNFVQRRGRTEVDVVLHEQNGLELDPMSAGGGGVVDLVAFGLRLSLLSLDGDARKLVILDEPFRCPSADLRPRIGALLRELNDRLGYQFIIVTHADELVEFADRVFRVEKKDGTSTVTEERS